MRALRNVSGFETPRKVGANFFALLRAAVDPDRVTVFPRPQCRRRGEDACGAEGVSSARGTQQLPRCARALSAETQHARLVVDLPLDRVAGRQLREPQLPRLAEVVDLVRAQVDVLYPPA